MAGRRSLATRDGRQNQLARGRLEHGQFHAARLRRGLQCSDVIRLGAGAIGIGEGADPAPGGTASISNSSRLPSNPGDRMLMPVVLPPGRASEGTRPSATMSSLMPMSGMILVASWKARV